MSNNLNLVDALKYMASNEASLKALASGGDEQAENILNLLDVHKSSPKNKALIHIFTTNVSDYLEANNINISEEIGEPDDLDEKESIQNTNTNTNSKPMAWTI